MNLTVEYEISNNNFEDIEEYGQYFYMSNQELYKSLENDFILFELINKTILYNNKEHIVTGLNGTYNNVKIHLANKKNF